MKKTLLFSLLIPILLPPTLLFSQDTADSSLSGEVSAGVLFLNSADNLDPGGSSRTISTLGKSAEKKLTTIPVLLPEVTWQFGAERRFAWYFKTKAPLEEAGEFALTTGLKYTHPGFATLVAGFFAVPFAEVWENPYLLNRPRNETDVTVFGAHIAANEIFDSEFSLDVAYMREDVDNDLLAQIFPELARDGKIFAASLRYQLFAGEPFSLTPRVTVLKGEYDGESSSFAKVKGEISGLYLAGRYSLKSSLSYSYKEHDERDPIFAATRNEHGFGANLAVKYDGLFGIESVGLLAIVGYSRGEASQTFYDSESLACGLGLTYRF